MNCEASLERMDAFLSDELAGGERQELAGHLETCAQCSAEWNLRTRVRDRLRAAVRATSVPATLDHRVRTAVRGQARRTYAGWYTLATAAIVLICAAVFGLTKGRPPEEAILSKAQGRLAAVLNVGLRDHLHCAVFRKYPKDKAEPAAQMAEQLGPAFAGLAPQVRAKLPGEFRLLEAHKCTTGGREYVHFIATNGVNTLSLVMTAQRPGDDLGGGISQEGVERYQVVGFQSHGYLVYVVSDLDAQRNLQLSAQLAPTVRYYLESAGGRG